MLTIRKWPAPTKNGIQLQFSSIDLGIVGSYFPWVTEISYDPTLEPGEARGASPFPMGVTLGEYKVTASLTIHRIHRQRLFELVKGVGPGAGVFDKFFPITVTYQEFGWDSVETDVFSARMTGAGHEFSTGNGVLLVKIPLYVPYVIMNGMHPLSGMAGVPA